MKVFYRIPCQALAWLIIIGFGIITLSAYAVSTQPLKILILGDSLTEGYGVPPEKAYPFLLGVSLKQKGYVVEIINGGESGSTTAGGLSRLPWYLKGKPDLVLIALGGNDGLRGQPLQGIEKNLTAMINLAKKSGAKVHLLGQQIPPNYGKNYTQGFAAIYPRVAKENKVTLLPFLLAGVGGVSNLMQKDGIHPNEKGHAIMVRLVEESLIKHSLLSPSSSPQ